MSTATAHPNRTRTMLPACSLQRQRVLLLDYDGTIAPFVKDRSLARPYPFVPELLDEIGERCETRVVIITGRRAKDITLLLGLRTMPEIWGCHGVERLLPNGQYSRVRLNPEAESALEQTAARLQSNGLEAHMECKPGCVAVHWRGETPKRMEEIRTLAYRVMSRFYGRNELFICDFDGGLELKHRACTKRFAVETIVSELDADVALAYLGDDVTDEDAFRALAGKGITILVRPSYRFTAAQFWLQPPEQLRQFFSDWIHACKGGDN